MQCTGLYSDHEVLKAVEEPYALILQYSVLYFPTGIDSPELDWSTSKHSDKWTMHSDSEWLLMALPSCVRAGVAACHKVTQRLLTE